MKSITSALALAVAAGSLAMATPALAQAQPAPAAAAPRYEPKISSSARKEIVDLQTAVNAKDTANIPAKIAAAQAKAKTKDDRYVIAQLQLKAAVDANDTAASIAGLEAVLASDALPAADTAPLYNSLGKLHYNAKAYDKAGTAMERLLQLEPNNVEATVMLGEIRNGQGRTAEAITLIQKAIATRTAAGQKPDESWYKRTVALAFNAKLPNSSALAREWVGAYPSPKNWREAIRVFQLTSRNEDSALIDSMRLAQATGGLSGESDYFRFANALVTKGYPGEAKAVLEQGFAAKSIDKNKPTFSQIYALASTRSEGDRASLDASATAAKAAPDAKKAMTTADAYYGYGDYAKAADLYRVALTKAGVDKDLANLRLGMALARQGDKAGATAALNAAGGQQAEVAKFWQTYVATKA